MWIYSKNNFLSIVEDHDDPDLLLVRARFKGDIEALFPKAKVIVGGGTDYLFRAWVKREEVAKVVAEQIMHLNYTNFKNANKDSRQKHLMKLWHIMYDAQLDDYNVNEDMYY